MSNKEQAANKIQYDEFINRMKSSEVIAKAEQDGSYAVFDKFFQKVPLPSMLIDMADGTLIDLNHKYQEEFGFTKAEAIGKTPIELGLWESLELIKGKNAQDKRADSGICLKIRTKSGMIP